MAFREATTGVVQSLEQKLPFYNSLLQDSSEIVRLSDVSSPIKAPSAESPGCRLLFNQAQWLSRKAL